VLTESADILRWVDARSELRLVVSAARLDSLRRLLVALADA